ncbi:Hypothetical predicted protein [Pelobates cultripes]|uniref:Uncharacterized protein n=1 Tax=Pelobates cultripes TaxID=61616 RepID=A0AAD1R6J7_PELCU|nr:Hypothetical predicted protein [Pelobates cultripes]
MSHMYLIPAACRWVTGRRDAMLRSSKKKGQAGDFNRVAINPCYLPTLNTQSRCTNFTGFRWYQCGKRVTNILGQFVSANSDLHIHDLHVVPPHSILQASGE